MATLAQDVSTEPLARAPLYPPKVIAQKGAIPEIYGAVEFTRLPERYSVDPADAVELPARMAGRRAELLADEDCIATIRGYTMMGDRTADAYAALMPEFGFRRLVDMLDRAC
ncbi:MAG: hypothetical protein VX465_09270, partial [Pseudomonadota bacterium]|nr:hypothetical protein [Pseudomonadota bacterium]